MTSMLAPGFGSDHDDKVEEDFVNWKDGMWKHIWSQLPDIEDEAAPSKVMSEAAHFRIECSGNPASQQLVAPGYDLDINYSKWSEALTGQISKITELRKTACEQFSSVMIDIKVSENCKYKTAQNIVIFPENSAEKVRQAMAYLNLPEDFPGVIVYNCNDTTSEKKTFKQFCPNGVSVLQLLKSHVDLSGTLRFDEEEDQLDQFAQAIA